MASPAILTEPVVPSERAPRKPKQADMRPSRRWVVTLDGGRRFVIYAPNRAGAVQRVIEAGLDGLMVYDGPKLVALKSLGHVVNAQEEPLAQVDEEPSK